MAMMGKFACLQWQMKKNLFTKVGEIDSKPGILPGKIAKRVFSGGD